MRLRNTLSTALFFGLVVLTGCGKGGEVRISGHFIGAAERPVYLEKVIPGESTPLLDTVMTNGKGEFDIRVKLPGGEPTLYNLRYEGAMVPLLLSPRERVSVMSLGDLDGYRVSGSPESELIWQLHGILSGGARSLDSLANLFRSAPEGERKESLRKEWQGKYYGIKRRHLSFIVENASSLAAVYALSQRLPGDDVLFGGDSDFVYYQMVADSVEWRYPNSRYVRALQRKIAEDAAARELVNRIEKEGIAEVNHPDIELPNMYGQRMKLSSLAGKVIVLDFWITTDTQSRLMNADMKELWNEYSDKGLAIYQVSLDTSKPLWVNAVQEQKLPWTTVCDFRGGQTAAARLYNVTAIPCNFIIDREGSIVGRNLYGDALEKKLRELL
jgi:peroxiredoxin